MALLRDLAWHSRQLAASNTYQSFHQAIMAQHLQGCTETSKDRWQEVGLTELNAQEEPVAQAVLNFQLHIQAQI